MALSAALPPRFFALADVVLVSTFASSESEEDVDNESNSTSLSEDFTATGLERADNEDFALFCVRKADFPSK